MDFYVYAYLREDGSPYYIGKGRKNRAFTKHAGVERPKNRDLIQFIERNLSQDEAFALETQLIAKFGRKDLGTGILLNRTNGGDGSPGWICKAAWQATREKRVEAQRRGCAKAVERKSAVSKLTWADPALMKKQSETLKAVCTDPEVKLKRSLTLKAAWARRKTEANTFKHQ